MTELELHDWLGLADGQAVPAAVLAGMRDIPLPVTDAEQIAAFQTYLATMPLPAGSVVTGAITRHGPEIEYTAAEAGALVADVIDQLGPAPGLWSPPDDWQDVEE